MTKAGEESGNLVSSLNEVATSDRESLLIKEKNKRSHDISWSNSHLSMILIGVFMLVYIVPTLTKTFQRHWS
jgi:type II secretory pathway component PulF